MVMKTKGTARRDLFVYHAQQANFQWVPNFSSLWSFSCECLQDLENTYEAFEYISEEQAPI